MGVRKKLILIGGMPGSGKTYIGIELARQLGVFIDKDTISHFFTEKMLMLLGSHVDLPTARERIIVRGESRDSWKLDNWDDYVASLPESVPSEGDVIVIDNSQTPEVPLFEKIDLVVNEINGGAV